MKQLLALLFTFALAAPCYAQVGSHSEVLPYTAKAADFTVAGQAVYITGWSIRESAGSANVATVVLRNGADTDTDTGGVQCAASGGSVQVGGQELAFIELAASNSETITLDYPLSAGFGVCADVLAGTVDLTLYISR